MDRYDGNPDTHQGLAKPFIAVGNNRDRIDSIPIDARDGADKHRLSATQDGMGIYEKNLDHNLIMPATLFLKMTRDCFMNARGNTSAVR